MAKETGNTFGGKTKTKTEVSDAFKNPGPDTASKDPLKGSGSTAFAPPSSKPDSWVKGGEKGEFAGPDSRREHSFK